MSNDDIKKPSPCCGGVSDVPSSWRAPMSYTILRIGLGLLVIILAESFLESYAQFWSQNYESIPLEEVVENADIVNALLLTLAALVASLVAFPLIGWLAIVKQSSMLANYFATMSIAWALYVIVAVDDMPLTNIAFVSSLAATSVTYAVKLHQRPTIGGNNVHDAKVK